MRSSRAFVLCVLLLEFPEFLTELKEELEIINTGGR